MWYNICINGATKESQMHISCDKIIQRSKELNLKMNDIYYLIVGKNLTIVDEVEFTIFLNSINISSKNKVYLITRFIEELNQ